MRFDRCALCKKFISPPDIVSLETSNCTNNGISLEICSNCESALADTAEKHYLELLLEEEIVNG